MCWSSDPDLIGQPRRKTSCRARRATRCFRKRDTTISDIDDPQNWALKSCAGRMNCDRGWTSHCAVGGSSYFKRLPLERYFRDARAGLYHPPDSDETLETLGAGAFGLPPSDRMSSGLKIQAQAACRREANRRVD